MAMAAAIPLAAAMTGSAAALPGPPGTWAVPTGVPVADLSTHDIVVTAPPTPTTAEQLAAVTGVVHTASGGYLLDVTPVPSSALAPVKAARTFSGRTDQASVSLDGHRSGPLGDDSVADPSCQNATGSISGSVDFSPSGGASLGVSWVNVWAGIIWAPEISGSVSFSPNASLSLTGIGFGGSCEADFNTPQVEVATVDTFVGPLSLCFGATGDVGASVGGTLSQTVSATLGGSIGTNFHFGVNGAGLSPYNSISASATSTPFSGSWSGSIYVGGGPFLDGEWGVCDVAGVGVQAQLNTQLTLSGSSSGWSAVIAESVTAQVNLNVLDYSYNQTIANWDAFSDTLASGSWPSSGGGGGGGGGGCGTDHIGDVVMPC